MDHEHNREWYQLILKKRSAGPTTPPAPNQPECLLPRPYLRPGYLRRFVFSDKFRATYDLPETFYAVVETDDLALLKFGYRFLRQVLFAEFSIPEQAGAWDKRVNQRQEVWDLRRQAEIARASRPRISDIRANSNRRARGGLITPTGNPMASLSTS